MSIYALMWFFAGLFLGSLITIFLIALIFANHFDEKPKKVKPEDIRALKRNGDHK